MLCGPWSANTVCQTTLTSLSASKPEGFGVPACLCEGGLLMLADQLWAHQLADCWRSVSISSAWRGNFVGNLNQLCHKLGGTPACDTAE